MLTHITNENYETEVKNSELPVIADYWASWCGPCQMMGPVFEELSADYESKLKFAKVNVEEQQELASKAGVMGIPCLIIFNKGVEVDRIVGFAPKEILKQKIDAVLNKL